jgi:hypothetical protein
MTKSLVIAVALAGCGDAVALPPPRTPERIAADAPALDALRAAKFDAAFALARQQLAIAPQDSEAAAIHAIAGYQQAAATLYVALDVRSSWFIFDRAFRDEAKAPVQAFDDRLDAIDRDLAVVAADPQFTLELCLACWQYDWNHDGRIDEHDQRLFQIERDDKGESLPPNDPRRQPTFKFDVGDALWARAMLSFQRAGAELLLAYRWSDLEKSGDSQTIVVPLLSADRVKRARALLLAGLDFSDKTRKAYLAETDDDREWVPNPHQHSHPVPLDADAKLYDTWEGVVGDVRRLVSGDEGISMRELGPLISTELAWVVPDAYVDIGRMLDEPVDIRIEAEGHGDKAKAVERMLRGVLGHGYRESMKPSPLVGRIRSLAGELASGGDTLDEKLRYLMWVN